jgi:hypothetical protein
MSTWRMLADIEVTMQKTGVRVLAVDDLNSAFYHVSVEKLIDLHAEALKNLHQVNFAQKDKEKTLALVVRVLRGHDLEHERGIDQGNPYSPTGLNVLLHYYHDILIKKEISRNLLWWRYADNLVYLCQSMSEGWKTLSEVYSLLQALGMTLKGEDGVKDLAHGDVAHLLGFSLWWEGETLHLEVEPETLDALKKRLGRAHVTPNPPRTALEVVQGWIEAYAPAFEDGDVSHVLAIVARSGFREGISQELLKEWWQEAWNRWQDVRVKARRRYRERNWPRTSSPSPSAGFV